MGRQLDGLAALHEASSAGLDGPLRDQYASYELTDLTFLRADVAIGHKRAWATTAEGERLDVGHAMVALYVFVEVDGRWWVAARQNTLVPMSGGADGVRLPAPVLVGSHGRRSRRGRRHSGCD
jgi:uncharacterized protein (TIGR02246 family)